MKRSFYDMNGNIIDYYQIFNIPFDADDSLIKSSFYKLVKLYHPDSSKNFSDHSLEKLHIVINGYRILRDPEIRKNYTSELFKKNSRNHYDKKIIPQTRIRYSISLEEMLKKKSILKKIKRKDIRSNFNEDIKIFITAEEQLKGALAYIELPARTQCPLCQGNTADCYICHGLGRIHTSSSLEITIPPGIKNQTLIEADLTKIRPDRLSNFRAKSIRIRISLSSEPLHKRDSV